MASDPTDWHQALARVNGQLVRGEQRVTTHELLTVLGVPFTDRACRRLRRVMRGLGWRGPRLMRWGKKTLHGYWRHPTAGLPAVVREEPVTTMDRETLAPELERVTWLGLQKLEQILRIPTDRPAPSHRLPCRLERWGPCRWLALLPRARPPARPADPALASDLALTPAAHSGADPAVFALTFCGS
jgi:hypothetical protein